MRVLAERLVIRETERAQTAEEKAAIAARKARAKQVQAEADAFDWAAFEADNVDLYAECQDVESTDPHHNKQRIWRKLKSGRDGLSNITDAEVLAELASRHRGTSSHDPNANRWILRGLSYWSAKHKCQLDSAERRNRSIAYEKGLD